MKGRGVVFSVGVEIRHDSEGYCICFILDPQSSAEVSDKTDRSSNPLGLRGMVPVGPVHELLVPGEVEDLEAEG